MAEIHHGVVAEHETRFEDVEEPFVSNNRTQVLGVKPWFIVEVGDAPVLHNAKYGPNRQQGCGCVERVQDTVQAGMNDAGTKTSSVECHG